MTIPERGKGNTGKGGGDICIGQMRCSLHAGHWYSECSLGGKFVHLTGKAATEHAAARERTKQNKRGGNIYWHEMLR